MAKQYLFSVARVDLFATDINHVLGTVNDEDVTFVVHPYDISRTEPTLRDEDLRRCLRAFVIPGRDRSAPRPEFPNFPDSERPSMGVDHFQFSVTHGPPT